MTTARWWFYGAFIGLPLALVGAAYLGLLVFAPPDRPFQPDAALLSKLERVPDNENAMREFSRIGAGITRDQEVGTGTRARDLLNDGRPFQASLARVFVRNNAGAFAALERAVRLPRSVSRARNPDVNSTAMFIPNMLELQKPMHLVLLRARLAEHEGRFLDAWRDASLALRAATRVRQAGGTLIEGMIAADWSRRAHAILRGLIPRLPNGQYSMALEGLRPSAEEWRAAWRADYRFASVGLVELERHPEYKEHFIFSEEDYEWGLDDVVHGVAPYLPQRWTYQKGRTLEMLSEHTRASLADVGRCPSQASRAVRPTPEAPKGLALLQANSLGLTLNAVLTPKTENANNRFCKLALDHAVTASMLMLRERQWRNEALPGALERDPYTGKPLVFDAKARALVAGDGQSFKLTF